MIDRSRTCAAALSAIVLGAGWLLAMVQWWFWPVRTTLQLMCEGLGTSCALLSTPWAWSIPSALVWGPMLLASALVWMGILLLGTLLLHGVVGEPSKGPSC